MIVSPCLLNYSGCIVMYMLESLDLVPTCNRVGSNFLQLHIPAGREFPVSSLEIKLIVVSCQLDI